MTDLTKLSDKVLAKFARRAATMKMVLLTVEPSTKEQIERGIAAVVAELARRNVNWQGSAE